MIQFPRWQELRALGPLLSSRFKPGVRIWLTSGQIRILQANGQLDQIPMKKRESLSAALFQAAELIQHFMRDKDLKGRRLSLVFSDAFVSPTLIPVPSVGLSIKEQKEVVQRHYKRSMGKTAEDWHCTWVPQGQHMLAVALPEKAWQHLTSACDVAQCQLSSIKSLSFEILQQDFWAPHGWAIISDDDELTVAYLQDGLVHSFKSFTLGLASDEERLSLVQRQLAISTLPQKSVQWLDLRARPSSSANAFSSVSHALPGLQRLHPASFKVLSEGLWPGAFLSARLNQS